MLPFENITISLKELMMTSFMWGDEFLGWAKTSHMLPCEDVSVGPKESDDEVLHLILISSLDGPRQVICCHAKMSRLARRKGRRNPSLDLD
jgi:hypothetical protein